ncbi:hypothetical protein [Desulfosporosinus sp. Sb-LF]|uniref:hypothetical protein n=1 Tax=Desulfosporosinus sp. Sb-LF TaxID=2560027 RepID=UPI00107EF1A6|nr:hypothetical protein [Desulfosporosinus sp. Sb-LF]TGE31996.1 hypothetical protein E4K68_15085 [Desulfosporosinus sp. Sb-LF]
MKFGGNRPSDPYEPIGPQGFPMQLPNGQLGPGYSPGSIRNTLGSGLKASGFFQKDGKVQNSRGGFIGAKQPPPPRTPWQAPLPAQGMGNQTQYPQYPQEQGYNQGMAYNQGYNQGYSQGQVYSQGQSRQLILQGAQEGINGNGVATISPDNSFLLIVNLPPPQAFLAQGQAGMYATYLVDDKGKTGFLAGVLQPVGNGVYRAHFQSQVPLHHYSRVVVSVENPAQLGQAPNGPIILKVKEPMGVMTFLHPMKTTATSIWGKISGLISGRKNPQISPEAAPISPELIQSLNQMGVQPETMAPPIPPLSPPIEPIND